jgi:hypothetical protein
MTAVNYSLDVSAHVIGRVICTMKSLYFLEHIVRRFYDIGKIGVLLGTLLQGRVPVLRIG